MNELGRPRPVEGLWFDDGNIILRAGNGVHKLHKSILSLHSTILADMFDIPQPDVAESLDGLPVVELPDTEADVVHWLKSLLVPGYARISSTNSRFYIDSLVDGPADTSKSLLPRSAPTSCLRLYASATSTTVSTSADARSSTSAPCSRQMLRVCANS